MNFVLDRPLRLMPLHQKFRPILDQIFLHYGAEILVREFLEISGPDDGNQTRLSAALNLYFYQIRWSLQKMCSIWEEISPLENSKIYIEIRRVPREYRRIFKIASRVYAVKTFADILILDRIEYSRKYAEDKNATDQLLRWQQKILKGELEDDQNAPRRSPASRYRRTSVKERICIDGLSLGEAWNHVYRNQPARIKNFLWRASINSPEEFMRLKQTEVLSDRGMGEVSWRQIYRSQRLLKPYFKTGNRVSDNVWETGIFLLEHWNLIFDSLPPRVKRTLKTLSVRFPDQVIRLTEKTICSERGTGEKTWDEIVSLQNRVRELYFSGAENSCDSVLCVPDIFNSEAALSVLPFSVRAKTVLNRLGVQTLGRLLLMSESEVLAQRNSGRKTVDDIRQNLRGYFEFIQNPPPIDVGASFEGLMRRLCSDAKQSRYEWVVIARICRGETLESIGQKMGCSRERVRQILVMVATSIQGHFKASRTLCFVQDKMVEILLANDGAQGLGAWEQMLSQRLGWLEDSTISAGLKRAVGMFPILSDGVYFGDGDVVQLK